MPTTIGIIGGSGLYDMAELTDRRDVTVDTPFGPPSAPLVTGKLSGKDVVFLARHGVGRHLGDGGPEAGRADAGQWQAAAVVEVADDPRRRARRPGLQHEGDEVAVNEGRVIGVGKVGVWRIGGADAVGQLVSRGREGVAELGGRDRLGLGEKAEGDEEHGGPPDG